MEIYSGSGGGPFETTKKKKTPIKKIKMWGELEPEDYI